MAKITPYIKDTKEIIMNNNYPIGYIMEARIPSGYVMYYPFTKTYSYERNWPNTDNTTYLYTENYERDSKLYCQRQDVGIVEYVDGPTGIPSGGTHTYISVFWSGRTAKNWTMHQQMGYSIWIKPWYTYEWGFGIYEKNTTPLPYGDWSNELDGFYGVSSDPSQIFFYTPWQRYGIPNQSIIANSWNHIVYTRNLTRQYIYINGTKVYDVAYSTYGGATTFNVSCTPTGYNGPNSDINAALAHAVVYDRFLTPADVQDLYNSITL